MTGALTRAELLALVLRDLPEAAAPITDAEAWSVIRGEPLDDQLASRVTERLDRCDEVAEVEARYREQGAWILCAVDDDYPSRLRERLDCRAPALFYGVGDPSLLARDGIGVVGSRDLDDAAVRVAREVGQAVARAGVPLVSGGARGVDAIAMDAAASAGGSAVGVLVHPLLKEVRREGVRELIEDERLCLITPFVRSTGFVVANAMARNKIIYALSRSTLVVAADHGTGGTWSGATEAIRRRYAPVAVWSGSGAGNGNAALIEAGGVSVGSVGELIGLDPSSTGSLGAPQLTLDM